MQIYDSTGAVITARGRYKPLGDCSNHDFLHLHVSADSEEKVKLAVERIHRIMGPNPLKVHLVVLMSSWVTDFLCKFCGVTHRHIWQVAYVQLDLR
jgi:hypothetical protein